MFSRNYSTFAAQQRNNRAVQIDTGLEKAMSGNLPPAGWLEDADGVTRWWDGGRWTEHRKVDSNPPPAVIPSPTPLRPRLTKWPVVFIGVLTLAIAAAATTIFIALAQNHDSTSPPPAFTFSNIGEMEGKYLSIGKSCGALSGEVLGSEVYLFTCDGATVGLLYERGGNRANVKTLAGIRKQVSHGTVIHAVDWTWAVTISGDADRVLAKKISERFRP